jgi:hypothetical protein
MSYRDIGNGIMNIKKYNKSTIMLSAMLCLCVIGTGALRDAYGQGSLVETVGTMEISQEVDNAANSATPKRGVDTKKPATETNNVTAAPDRNPANMRSRQNPAAAPVQQENSPAMTGNETPMTMPVAGAEANIPDVNDFNGFKQELDRIDMEARGEDTQWLGKQMKKAELAKAMDEVVVAEMKFLRKVAAAEKDVNTVEAIDLLLKKRQDRLNKLVTKLDNELKEDRRQQAGERQQRRPARTTGGAQQQNQTERPARSTNPVQRTKETINQDQQP